MRRWLPALLCVLSGCGQPEVRADAELELGTGSYRFEPLTDGQEVELIHGAQGGFHIWLSLRARGIERSRATIRLTMRLADESRPPHEVEVTLPFDPPDDDGFRTLIGYTGIVTAPECLIGKLLRIDVSLPMDEGEPLHAERDVVVRGGAYPPTASCE